MSFAGLRLSGKASLRTFPEKDGVLPGDYLVSITKNETKEFGTPQGVQVSVKYIIPQRYNDFTKSGLKASVKAGAPAELTFDLVD